MKTITRHKTYVSLTKKDIHLVDKYTRSVLGSLSTNHTRAYAYKNQWLDFIKLESLIILKR